MSPTHHADPDRLAPDQRLVEVAAIFALGFRRMAADRRFLGESGGIQPESRATCLDRAQDAALMDPPVNRTGERRVE